MYPQRVVVQLDLEVVTRAPTRRRSRRLTTTAAPCWGWTTVFPTSNALGGSVMS